MPVDQAPVSPALSRDKVLAGASALAEAVRPTLGPVAKRFVLDRRTGAPLVSDEAAAIDCEIHLGDREEGLGARMLCHAAERTVGDVGDGTTLAALLAAAVLGESSRRLAAGADPDGAGARPGAGHPHRGGGAAPHVAAGHQPPAAGAGGRDGRPGRRRPR